MLRTENFDIPITKAFISGLVPLLLAYCVLAGLTPTGLAVADEAAQNAWPRFRGNNGTGLSSQQGFPVNWTAEDYAWEVTLPGTGHSSPVIWGNHVFTTCGSRDGTKRMLLCLDLGTGEINWQRELQLSSVHLHKKNSFASGSPATDGEHVYVSFADADNYVLAAFDFSGEPLWRKNFGPYESQHGPGASPMIYNDLVILTKDMLGPSAIFAVDKVTGEQVWESPRDYRRAAYSTPMIVQVEGEDQLICVSGATGVTGLDPQTGKELWRSGQLPMRTVASPAYGHGVVIALCGSGGSGKLMVAVEPSSKSGPKQAKVRYTRNRELPYVPTPIAYKNWLFLWSDGGVVSCLDIANGDVIWMKRVGGKFTGSPICVDGKLYCISEDGEVTIIAASDEYEELGRVPLNELSYSTPAVSGSNMLLRTESKLYCLKADS